MSYDHWKTTNPDDRDLGSAPQDNPHDFQVKEVLVDAGPNRRRVRGFAILAEDGRRVGFKTYATEDEANDAIGEMIADDDADRRLNRHRHEQRGD